MPTYDYECQACGHRFEKFQSMTARVLRKCPECSKTKLERLIGPGAGFLFKGDGFYITDYRSKSYRDGKKAAGDAASAPEKGGDAPAASDKPAAESSKPADKPAGKPADKPKGKKGGGGS